MRRVAALGALACGSCSVVLGIEARPLGDPLGERPDSAALGDGSPSTADGAGEARDAPVLEPPGCERSPTADPTVVDERCGVFVSSSGSDTNAGTRQAPLKTLAVAIQKAVDQKLYRAFLCGDAFEERVTMSGVGVSLVGGFECLAGWSVAARVPVIRPPDSGPALRLVGLTNAITLESLEFAARDATAAGTSSVAAWVSDAVSVTFVRSALAAGSGASGQSGAAGVLGTGGGMGGAPGGIGTVLVPGPMVTCHCLLEGADAGSTTGGAGGQFSPSVAPMAGTPALDGGAAGTNNAALAACTGGGKGADGIAGATSPAPTALGALLETGWSPASGGDGTAGSLAQGGGGGGAWTLGGGGGGGCGGCPSSGGKGGGGGGGSIALLSVRSGVSLVDTARSTKSGGGGGAGGAAPAGQVGGPGAGNAFGSGCSGGAGGTGGKGGDGAGGAGGISVGTLFRGAAPVIDVASQGKLTLGAGGSAGGGSVPGPAGLSQPTLSL